MRHPLSRANGFKGAPRISGSLSVLATRRDFIGGMMKAAFVMGATVAGVAGLFPDTALAIAPCTGTQCPGGCCNAGTQSCVGTCTRRNYASNCGTSGGGFCWLASLGGVTYLCCDCCTSGGSKCHCRFPCC
jgi:hypothetical protein